MKSFMAVLLSAVLLNLTPENASAQLKKSAPKEKMYKHTLAFHPLHVNADDFIGVGFSYERTINNNFGIKVPMMVSLNQPYVNLGVSAKFYPRKNSQDVVAYAIAPTLYFGKGEDHNREYTWDPLTGQENILISKTPRTQIGFLLNHSLNVYVANQVYLGLDGGIGINYYDNKAFRNNPNSNLSFAAQFHMAIGYRF
ncbi:MAG: hypothetical protein ACR2IL_00600 [Chitinophagaceae bacterium]